MIKKWRDYKRHKEIDKQARDIWADAFRTANYRCLDDDKMISLAHGAVSAFYDAFYPRIKS